MLFRWLRQRRRQQLLNQPFPSDWQELLGDRFVLYRLLTDEEKHKLHATTRVLVAEKNWEGCSGLELKEEMKVLIAAQASYLLLGLEHDYYERTPTILVYPSDFLIPAPPPPLEGPPQPWEAEGTAALGEAQYRGPVILSWPEVEYTASHPQEGMNLVFHEFAHQLDMLDGYVNGTPPLRNRGEERRWRRVMAAEFRELRRAVDHHETTLLDPEGARNEAEFFAIVTECFFTLPRSLRARHPQLYRLFGDYYRQDPAERATLAWESDSASA